MKRLCFPSSVLSAALLACQQITRTQTAVVAQSAMRENILTHPVLTLVDSDPGLGSGETTLDELSLLPESALKSPIQGSPAERKTSEKLIAKIDNINPVLFRNSLSINMTISARDLLSSVLTGNALPTLLSRPRTLML